MAFRNELEASKRRIAALEDELTAAEERATDAEERAEEAEALRAELAEARRALAALTGDEDDDDDEETAAPVPSEQAAVAASGDDRKRSFAVASIVLGALMLSVVWVSAETRGPDWYQLFDRLAYGGAAAALVVLALGYLVTRRFRVPLLVWAPVAFAIEVTDIVFETVLFGAVSSWWASAADLIFPLWLAVVFWKR